MGEMRGKFSIILLVLQAAFVLLFGFFVKYDDGVGARPGNTTEEHEVEDGLKSLYPMFQDVHVMVFVGFGFLMTFLKRYGFGSVSFNLLLAAFVLQWTILMRGSLQGEEKIPLNLETILNADFAAATVLISFGAVLGVLSSIQLIIMAVLEVAVYCANEHIIIEYLKINDIGGSLVIHTFGAYFGLAVSAMHWKKELSKNPKEGSVYHSDIFAMIGTLFLWVYWPSFNASPAAGTDVAHRAVINTIYSLAGSAIGAFIISATINKEGKFSMVHIQNATLAGGVGAGAVANLNIGPFGAILVGTSVGILSSVGYKYITPTLARTFHIHDTCGVNNLHGMPGIFSAFVAVVVARMTTASYYAEGELESIYHNYGENGLQYQANMQMAGLAVTMGMAIVGGLITGLLLRASFLEPLKNDDLFDDNKFWITGEEEIDEKSPSAASLHGSGEQIPLTPPNGGQVQES
nr:Rh type A glycoprotein [Molgula manhattensis]